MRRWRPPTRVGGPGSPACVVSVGAERRRAVAHRAARPVSRPLRALRCCGCQRRPCGALPPPLLQTNRAHSPRRPVPNPEPPPRRAVGRGRPSPLAALNGHGGRRRRSRTSEREPRPGRRDRQGASWTGVEPAVGSGFLRGEDNLGVLPVRGVCVRALGIEMEHAERARAVAHARPVGRCSGQALGCSSLRGSNGRIWIVVSAMLEGR